ncbi:hypothetical protein EV681_4538 [Advenella incenata]|uniref:Large polyvalent protein-associated domain-containing protein n=1 Tax=Advenella incenata TaxID=267800 RepID=A0A4Q7V4M9_9BURK|nr:LPD7 domain-containing protein [Advenella incenata]RZT91185.1 hypothetical protein EV681_4538 [Advenella incenata]
MLAKISSGVSGIREYLESGRKQGREYDRDLIDRRVVLDGDIEVMDHAISLIDTKQEGDSRYLHITLSFAEHFTEQANLEPGQINLETIRQVTQQYKQDLMAAFEAEEYVFYAEAHIPIVTHDIHSKTGESIERLPHVHIVIPTKNLINDRYLNPLGYGNVHFHDAIQEKINNDFSLKSPDDAPRETIRETNLVRHVPNFVDNVKSLRQGIIERAELSEAKTLDDIAAIAADYGEVKIRKGRDGDYINVKPAWASKGVNLKELTAKTLPLQREKESTPQRPPAEHMQSMVKQWTERRALEARYVSSAGRRSAYAAMTEPDRQTWLEERRENTRDTVVRKLNEGLYESRKINGKTDRQNERAEPGISHDGRSESSIGGKSHQDIGTPGAPRQATDRGSDFAESSKADASNINRPSRNQRKAGIIRGNHYETAKYRGYKPSVAAVGQFPPPQRIHRLRNLSELGMVQLERESELLLPRDVSSNVDERQAADFDGLRRVESGRGSAERGINNEHPLSESIQRIGKRQITCIEMLTQSTQAAGRIDTTGIDPESTQLVFGRVQSILEGEIHRAGQNQKNLERQASVISHLMADRAPSISDKRLKTETSPALVLDAAAKHYGINLQEYSIGAGKDGTPRIFHASRQYNLGDFFTKHLNKPWDEAKPILKDCYYATLSEALPTPDKALWHSFNEWRSHSMKHRQNEKQTLQASLRKEVLATREHYKKQKAHAYQQKGPERHTLLAEARANRIDALERITQARQQGYEDLKFPGRNAEYRIFLTSLAQNGDLAALAELRRTKRVYPQPEPDFINGAKSKTVLPLPNYTIDSAGNVVYSDRGHAVVKDSVRGIEVLNAETRAYDLALKLAVSRYGSSLTLNGDQAFKTAMLEAAKRSGLELNLRDSDNPNKSIKTQPRER